MVESPSHSSSLRGRRSPAPRCSQHGDGLEERPPKQRDDATASPRWRRGLATISPFDAGEQADGACDGGLLFGEYQRGFTRSVEGSASSGGTRVPRARATCGRGHISKPEHQYISLRCLCAYFSVVDVFGLRVFRARPIWNHRTHRIVALFFRVFRVFRG